MNHEETLHAGVCKYIAHVYPKAIFNTDLSGIRLTQGLARKVIRLRSSNAFPDIVIYEPHRGYFALFIELKASGARLWLKDGTLSKDQHIQEQADMMIALRSRGYCVAFAQGLEQAVILLDWYFRFDKLDEPFPLKEI